MAFKALSRRISGSASTSAAPKTVGRFLIDGLRYAPEQRVLISETKKEKLTASGGIFIRAVNGAIHLSVALPFLRDARPVAALEFRGRARRFTCKNTI
jgi:hypothetical protein